MLLHHSRAFIEKHKKHHHLIMAMIALVVAGASVYVYRNELVQAATFTWVQDDWSASVTTATSTHPGGQTGWAQYSATSTSITADASGVSLSSVSRSFTDDGFKTSPFATAGDTPTNSVVDELGNLYVSNYGGGSVSKVAPNGSVSTISGLNGPRGMVLGPDGSIYVANGVNSTVSRITSGGTVSLFATLGATAGPFDIAVDTSGNFYTADNGTNTVTKITPQGATSTFATVGTGPSLLGFHANGNLYVVNGGGNSVSKVSPDGGTVVNIPTSVSPAGLAFDTNGNVYVGSINGDISNIYRINTSDAVSVFSSPIWAPRFVEFDTTTNNLYVLNQTGAVYKITPAGVSSLVTTVASAPMHMSFDATSGSMYIASITGSVVSKLRVTSGGFEGGTFSNATTTGAGDSASIGMSLTGGALSALSPATTSASGGYGIALSPNGGHLYNGTVFFSRNPSTGLLTSLGSLGAGFTVDTHVVSPDANGTSLYLTRYNSNVIGQYSRNNSTGAITSVGSDLVMDGTNGSIYMAVSPDGTSVYVTNRDTDTVSQFSRNTSTSVLTPLSPATTTTTGTQPYRIVVSPDGKSVYTANYGTGNVAQFSRDLGTGALTAHSPATVSVASGNPFGVDISPDGKSVYVTVRTINRIYQFSRNDTVGSPDFGELTALTPAYITTTHDPNDIFVSSDGTSVYTSAYAASSIAHYSRNLTTGLLTEVGTPISSGNLNAFGVIVSPDARNVYAINRTSSSLAQYSRSSVYLNGSSTSAVIDLALPADFTTLAFDSTVPAYTALTVDVRAGDTATPDGSWTSWVTGIASGGSLSALGSHRYVQYRANFSREDSSITPTLNSVTINYNQYATSGNLTSSKYDSSSAGNLVNRITWAASTSTTETVKFQIRSSADGNTWSGWCGGVSDITCDGSTYFVDADNGVAFATNSPLRSGGDDQFFQYKVFLTSGGGATPLLSSVSVQYVVNAPPDFDATYGTNGIVVAQVTDSGSADFGKVTISYKIRDIDTTTGTANANYITPSFQYNVGGGWVSIASDKLAAGDTSNKGVQEVNYSTYVATWTASSTITASTATAQVRVTINDNEAANSSAVATSANFTLDTTAPVASANLDSSSGGSAVGTVVLSATDISTLQYRLCNSNTFSSPDAQGNSCAWSVLGGNIASSSTAWIPTGAPNEETVYLEVRDLYGNMVAQTIVAPKTPPNFVYKDVADPLKDQYWEFLSWGIFQATTSSAFASYKIYHASSTSETPAPSAGDYSLVTTITDSSINFYRHIITSATSSYHFYKVQSIDTDGDISDFTAVVSDIPNGQGGIDTTAPLIFNVATSSVRSNSATITWDTDEISNSEVSYGTTQSYGSSVVVSSYTTTHSVTITGLAQNTTYYFRVRSTDPAATPNQSDWTIGGTFTTTGGPTIVESTDNNRPVVVPTNTSAEITWHTNVSSDSYVTYSTNSALSSGTRVGVATYTTTQDATGYVHTVTIPGLVAGTTYYFQVESTDANGTTYNKPTGTSVSHYSFNTNIDTQPPVISATSTPVLASDSTVIVWQTDELATSQVFYDTVSRGGNTAQYAYRTVQQSTESIFHVATLSSATEKYDNIGNSLILGGNVLTPETTYYTAVRSVDSAGNGASSNEWSFTTPSSGTVTIIQMGGSSKKGEIIPDTSAPIISGFKVSDITPFGAVVAFSTDEEAVSFAEFGKDTSYGDTAGSLKYAKDHKLKLRGLTLGTEYNIRAGAVDKAGNVGTGSNQTFKTAFLSENLKDLAQIENIEAFQKEIENTIESILPSLVPPFVSKPQVVEITDSSAKITFKTNIKSFPIVMYAEQGRYDDTKDNPYIGEVSNTENKGTEHTLALTGLKPNTKYHYQARAFSLPKVIGRSEDLTFITKAAKIAGSVVEKKKDSFTVVWTTTEPTTSIVEYKNLKTGVTDRKTDSAMKTSHSMKIENLPSGTTYAVDISGLTEAGNTVEAGSPLSVTTSTDVTAPVISGFKVDNAFIPGRADRVQTIISWTTDESANSVVYYEEGTGTAGDTKELARKSENLDSYITKHSIILPSLKPGTIYRIKVTSSDDSGNLGSFGPRTVITPRQTESITDIIFKNFEDSFKFLRQI